MEVNPTTLTPEMLDRLLDTPVDSGGEYKRELLRERARRLRANDGIIECRIGDEWT